jgi:hypothetical protein
MRLLSQWEAPPPKGPNALTDSAPSVVAWAVKR